LFQLSSDGSEVLFSTFLGGTKDDMATDIALDQDNNIYITGKTDSIDFPMIDPVEEPGGLNDVL
jgi:Beta-propeller repeat.